ncbi:MAG: hypothetical protein II680_11870 [Clostridia bacterium]|nr:hypothetical protein [Clostridia bacterium]
MTMGVPAHRSAFEQIGPGTENPEIAEGIFGLTIFQLNEPQRIDLFPTESQRETDGSVFRSAHVKRRIAAVLADLEGNGGNVFLLRYDIYPVCFAREKRTFFPEPAGCKNTGDLNTGNARKEFVLKEGGVAARYLHDYKPSGARSITLIIAEKSSKNCANSIFFFAKFAVFQKILAEDRG